jgi:hypothetical protein
MCSLGVDFGVDSAHALIVRHSAGVEYGTRVVDYPVGALGVWLDPEDFPAALVGRRARFALRPSIAQAVETATAMERFAHMALRSLQMAPDIQPIALQLRLKRFKRKHGADARNGRAINRRILEGKDRGPWRPVHADLADGGAELSI